MIQADASHPVDSIRDRLTADTPATRLLAKLKALMARSEQDRAFGPAACRLACLDAIEESFRATASSGDAGAPPQYPISLNDEQEKAIREWAADDRLWTTQETVEFNLRTFARTILKHRAEAPHV